MPIHLGAPMDENPAGAEPIVIFTATYEIYLLEMHRHVQGLLINRQVFVTGHDPEKSRGRGDTPRHPP